MSSVSAAVRSGSCAGENLHIKTQKQFELMGFISSWMFEMILETLTFPNMDMINVCFSLNTSCSLGNRSPVL